MDNFSLRWGGVIWLYCYKWRTCFDLYSRITFCNHRIGCVFLLILDLRYSRMCLISGSVVNSTHLYNKWLIFPSCFYK